MNPFGAGGARDSLAPAALEPDVHGTPPERIFL